MSTNLPKETVKKTADTFVFKGSQGFGLGKIGVALAFSLLLHLVAMKMPMPSQQSELDESLEIVEPVPIKLEREEPILDIATSSIPAEPKTETEPPKAPAPTPAASTQAPPRLDDQLEPEIEAESATNQEGEAPESEPEPVDEAPFEYNQAGFAILDEALQLEGSTACGNQEGCFQVDESFRDASEDLEALFKSQGYESDEIQVADDSAYKAYRLTSLENPELTQYLYVLNRKIENGPGQFPDIVTFYVVTQEAQTLADLNQKLADN